MRNIICTYIVALAMTVVIQGYSDKVNSELQNNVIRLHILANSDSKSDQRIKLKVRDAILNEVSLKDKDFLQKSETVANSVLSNYNYKAIAKYGEFYFPTKKYKNVTLPCGKYNSVRIVLGEGEGQNWWCVLYPPMCLSEGEVVLSDKAQKKLKNIVSEDTYELITKDGIVIKFKIVDIFNKIRNYKFVNDMF